MDVSIADTWFVRNFQDDATIPAALLAFTTNMHEPAYFKDVAISNSAFLGNAFITDLALNYVMTAKLDRVLFYRTWPAGQLLTSTTSQDVIVNDSVIVVDDLARVAAIDHSPPIRFTGTTKIYAKSYKPGAAIPDALKVDRAALSDRAAIDATAKDVDAAVAMPVGMPDDALRAKVDKALRP